MEGKLFNSKKIHCWVRYKAKEKEEFVSEYFVPAADNCIKWSI